MHHPLAWYFFILALFLLWAYGVADSIHTLRQRETKSFWALFGATWVAIEGVTLMLIMIVVVVIAAFKGVL